MFKICSKCPESLPFAAFSVSASGKDGYRGQCKACRVKCQAERIARSPEKGITAEKRRRYAQNRPELTAERLRGLLSYDAVNGWFYRLTASAKVTKIGDRAGTIEPHGYVTISVDGAKHFAHRLAWLHVHGEWPANAIDHINGNRADNRIENLRSVDSRTNAQNRRKALSDGRLLGASFHAQSRKWRAQIRVGGRQKYIGLFDTEEQAHLAYVEAKRLLHDGCTI